MIEVLDVHGFSLRPLAASDRDAWRDAVEAASIVKAWDLHSLSDPGPLTFRHALSDIQFRQEQRGDVHLGIFRNERIVGEVGVTDVRGKRKESSGRLQFWLDSSLSQDMRLVPLQACILHVSTAEIRAEIDQDNYEAERILRQLHFWRYEAAEKHVYGQHIVWERTKHIFFKRTMREVAHDWAYQRICTCLAPLPAAERMEDIRV